MVGDFTSISKIMYFTSTVDLRYIGRPDLGPYLSPVIDFLTTCRLFKTSNQFQLQPSKTVYVVSLHSVIVSPTPLPM